MSNKDTIDPQPGNAPTVRDPQPLASRQPPEDEADRNPPDTPAEIIPFDLKLAAAAREEHGKSVAGLLPDKRKQAVEFLSIELGEAVLDMQNMIAEDPLHWWSKPRGGNRDIGYPGMSFHSSGGRALRNALRGAGMDEAWFGIGNLDDIYVGLVELAVMGEQYYSDVVEMH